MSHELRTPLNAVIGFSQILMAKDDMPKEKIRTFVEKINVSGKHLLNLVNNILDFSKIESGMMNLNKREILLENFINDTTLLVENETRVVPVTSSTNCAYMCLEDLKTLKRGRSAVPSIFLRILTLALALLFKRTLIFFLNFNLITNLKK